MNDELNVSGHTIEIPTMPITPVPVVIVAEPEPRVTLIEPAPSDFAGMATYFLNTNPAPPIQILGYAARRKRAYLRLWFPAGVNQVVLGTREQCMNASNSPTYGGVGYQLQASATGGSELEYTSSAPLFALCIATTAGVFLSVLDEQYR